jgi:hypothetical protein
MKLSARAKLGLKIFVLIFFLNTLIIALLIPEDNKIETPELEIPKSHLIIQIKAQLLTPFEKGKPLFLINTLGEKAGPVLLLERSDELISLSIDAIDYQKILKKLNLDEWSLVPYYSQTEPKGDSYEIIY